jgi:hypothetical protein
LQVEYVALLMKKYAQATVEQAAVDMVGSGVRVALAWSSLAPTSEKRLKALRKKVLGSATADDWAVTHPEYNRIRRQIITSKVAG